MTGPMLVQVLYLSHTFNSTVTMRYKFRSWIQSVSERVDLSAIVHCAISHIIEGIKLYVIASPAASSANSTSWTVWRKAMRGRCQNEGDTFHRGTYGPDGKKSSDSKSSQGSRSLSIRRIRHASGSRIQNTYSVIIASGHTQSMWPVATAFAVYVERERE